MWKIFFLTIRHNRIDIINTYLIEYMIHSHINAMLKVEGLLSAGWEDEGFGS